jgi:tripartite-type tricarboxylate transporter receptor subunit TctC
MEVIQKLKAVKRIKLNLNLKREVIRMRNKFSKVFVVLLILMSITLSFMSGCKPQTAKVTYPEKAVTIICPWAAGGGTDALARLMADQLQKKLGQPFVVENKTGGGGATGHVAGALAKPDGYTLTLVTLEIATMHWMGLTDVTVDNFDFVIQLNQDPAAVLVKADAPWKTINDLLDDIKKNPGKFKFSGSGAGTIWDLSRIGMLNAAGIPVNSVTWIPTTGAAPSITELLGGHVDVITCSLPEAKSQLDAGLIKALAVMSDDRVATFPNIPTLKESGINWSSGTWRGIAVPRGTPQEIINILYTNCNDIANSSEFKDFMSQRGFGIKIRNSEEFTQFAKEQDQTWKEMLKLGGYAQ